MLQLWVTCDFLIELYFYLLSPPTLPALHTVLSEVYFRKDPVPDSHSWPFSCSYLTGQLQPESWFCECMTCVYLNVTIIRHASCCVCGLVCSSIHKQKHSHTEMWNVLSPWCSPQGACVCVSVLMHTSMTDCVCICVIYAILFAFFCSVHNCLEGVLAQN